MSPSLGLAHASILYLPLLLLRCILVQCQSDESFSSNCFSISAQFLGSGETATFQDTFTCSEGAYVSGVIINYGWWMDALKIFCSDGNESSWYGNNAITTNVNESSLDTGGGLISMSSHFKIYGDHAYPCHITFFAYTGEEEDSSSGSEFGPYGSCGRISSVTSTSTWDTVSGEFKGTSDCGLDAYAIGFDVRYEDEWIYGLGLQCRTITAACSAPDGLAVPYTPVPTSMPLQETPAPMEPRMEIGEDCSKYGCHEDLCCSEGKLCGAMSSFCRRGRCCRTWDESECEAGSNQCIIREGTEDYWYDNPIFVGTSTAIGLLVTLGGTCYAVYRYFCEGRERGFSSRSSD